MSTHELVAAFNFLYTTLSGDSRLATLAPGGVSRGVAPLNTATPFVVMSLQSPGNDTLTSNAYRILTLPLMQIKAVGPASVTAQIGQAAARIDDLLKLTSGTVTGAYIDACYRESPLFLDELVDGVLWCSIGGLYRLEIQTIS